MIQTMIQRAENAASVIDPTSREQAQGAAAAHCQVDDEDDVKVPVAATEKKWRTVKAVTGLRTSPFVLLPQAPQLN